MRVTVEVANGAVTYHCGSCDAELVLTEIAPARIGTAFVVDHRGCRAEPASPVAAAPSMGSVASVASG